MPVLPEVGSMMVESFFSRPFCSASSIIDSAMRSLMLAPGFARSSLIHTSCVEPNSRFTLRWGVLPMVSRMVLARMGPRPLGWMDDRCNGRQESRQQNSNDPVVVLERGARLAGPHLAAPAHHRVRRDR